MVDNKGVYLSGHVGGSEVCKRILEMYKKEGDV